MLLDKTTEPFAKAAIISWCPEEAAHNNQDWLEKKIRNVIVFVNYT